MLKVGDRVGKLTLLERKRENKRTYFYCRCDCGTEKWVRDDTLKVIVSCGCYNREKNLFKPKDITGKRFGRLIALKPLADRDRFSGSIVWLCKCDCGNIAKVIESSLVRGATTSCGCVQQEARRENIKKATQKNVETNIVEHTNIKHISRTKPIKSNTSGVTGVRWDESRQKWLAQIEFQGKRHYLGRYKNKEDAIKARKEAEEKYFKNFLNNLEQKEDR